MTDPPTPPGEAPGDDADAGLGGDLGTVTDEEWQTAHDQLVAGLAGVVPAEQLAYTWAPGEEAAHPIDVNPHYATVPPPGRYEPTADGDERFEEGGFRG